MFSLHFFCKQFWELGLVVCPSEYLVKAFIQVCHFICLVLSHSCGCKAFPGCCKILDSDDSPLNISEEKLTPFRYLFKLKTHCVLHRRNQVVSLYNKSFIGFERSLSSACPIGVLPPVLPLHRVPKNMQLVWSQFP